MITFVNADKVRRKRDPGRCFVKAGFKRIGKTKGGLIALQMMPCEIPDAIELPEVQLSLFAA